MQRKVKLHDEREGKWDWRGLRRVCWVESHFYVWDQKKVRKNDDHDQSCHGKAWKQSIVELREVSKFIGKASKGRSWSIRRKQKRQGGENFWDQDLV